MVGAYNISLQSPRDYDSLSNMFSLELPSEILLGSSSFTRELVSQLLCQASVYLISLYESMVLVIIASRLINPLQLVSCICGVKYSVNSVGDLSTGSLKNNRSAVRKPISVVGTKGQRGQCLTDYCNILCFHSLGTWSDFVELFLHMIHLCLTTFIKTDIEHLGLHTTQHIYMRN